MMAQSLALQPLTARPAAAPRAAARRSAAVCCAPETATTETAAPAAEPAAPVPPKPETFNEIMGFSSYGPELINGRVSQVAFLAAIGAEVATHETLATQIGEHSGALIFASALISLASLMPRLVGGITAKPETRKDEGMWKPSTELLNGRAAMVGLVALFATEQLSGHSLL